MGVGGGGGGGGGGRTERDRPSRGGNQTKFSLPN